MVEQIISWSLLLFNILLIRNLRITQQMLTPIETEHRRMIHARKEYQGRINHLTNRIQSLKIEINKENSLSATLWTELSNHTPFSAEESVTSLEEWHSEVRQLLCELKENTGSR